MDQIQLAQQLRDEGGEVGLSRQGNILRVDLRNCNENVTDESIAFVAGCGQLKELYLSNSQVTDSGVASIGKLEKLHTIDLQNTQITDAAIQSLAALPNLKVLLIRGTQVSREYIASLRKEMTGTRIIFD